jgi:IclR family transcriptional regulator, mhp operon transcriptional activator
VRNYKVKPINGLSRGLDVLRALQAMRAASLHDLHQTTGLSKSTLTRIVHTLHLQGMVWQRMVDGAYLPSHSLQQRAQLDNADWLVEIASPVLESLCKKVSWPSVLTIPRLDYVEVLETNRPLSYFGDILLGPIGFRANMLRSASGRAYLAFCPDREREAVLHRLRQKNQPGDEKAHDARWVEQVVETTRQRGYSVRDPDFGGHYSKTRQEVNDERNSIAMPIQVNGHVLGCINLTWKSKHMSAAAAVKRHLAALREAINTVEQRAISQGVITVSKNSVAKPAVRRTRTLLANSNQR